MKKIIIFAIFVALSTIAIAQNLAGTTKGDFSVSQTGAATYKIDIDAPAGNNEFRPQISLCYNSQSANSIAGYGWNIVGLSSISATPHSRYYDTTNIKGVNADSNDAYSIDGTRLLLKSGTNGRQNAEYVTEQESYCKIVIDSAFANTPKSFIVKKPNGSIYKYGSTANGTLRYPASNSTAAISWLLDYAEDKDGNIIKYTYTYYNNIPYITKIQYGGNKNGIQPLCSINFAYSNREDTISSHVKNTTYKYTKRLSGVYCYYNNILYKRYSLTYDNSSGFSHLISVKEYGTESSNLPSTTFEWQDLPEIDITSTQISVPYTIGTPNSAKYYLSGDVDNDGKSELIAITPLTTSYSDVSVYHHSDDGFYFVASYNASSCYEINGMYNFIRGGVLGHFCNTQSNTIVLPYIYRNIDGDFSAHFEFTSYGQYFSSPLQHTTEMPAYSIADYDKDGIDAIVYAEKKSLNNKTIRLVTINCNFSTQTYSQSEQNLVLSQLTSSQQTGKVEALTSADFDGDGLTDILVECTNHSIILWNTNGSFNSSNYSILTNVKYSESLKIADFNGDGLADLLINELSSTTWKKAINTGIKGSSIFNVSTIQNLTSKGIKRYSDDEYYSCFIQDLNSDGLSDIVISYKSGSSQKFCWVVAHRNNTFSILSEGTNNPTTNNTKRNLLVQGDFNGDGHTNIISLNISTDSWKLLANRNYSIACNKIKKITDGLGKATEIEYKSLLDGYTNNNTASMPLLKFYAAIPVVKTSKESWRGTEYITSYKFSDGLIHVAGKGFLGFVNQTITSDGIKQIKKLSVNNTYYASDIEFVSTKDLDNNEIARHSYRYSYQNGQTSKSFEKHLVDDVEKSFSTGKIDRKYFSNFHYGKPGRIISGNNITQTTNIEYTDITTNGKWILGLPTSIDLTHETKDEDGDINNFYERSTFDYDANGHVLCKKDYKSNTADNLSIVNTSTFSYDAFGNAISQSNKPFIITRDSLTTIFEYNSNGLLSKKIEADGHAKEYTYNANGRLSAERDLWFSTLIEHTYDGIGREVRTIKKSETSAFTPDTTQISYSAIQNGVWAFKVTKSSSTLPTEHEYYDGFGRNNASSSIHFDGREFIVDRLYSGKSLMSFESVPHLSGTNINIGTTYGYDSFKRPTLITDPEGKTIQTQYDTGYKRITENDVTTDYYYDEDGNLECKFDDKGDVWYYYNALGNYDHITLSYLSEPNKTITYTYDKYGRLSRFVNQNGDSQSYTYDARGNISSHSINSESETYSYNRYGDITQKSYKPQNVTATARYTYNNKRQLTAVSGSNYSVTYSYNNAGMLLSKSRSVSTGAGPHSRTAIYSYIGENQLSSVSHVLDGVSDTLTENYTYQRKWLTDIRLNGRNIWHLNSEDSHGTTSSTSNWLSSTQFSYDNSGKILDQNTSIASNNGTVPLSLSYQYDIHGRIVNKNGKSYEYDDYNQLTGWNGNSYSYDDWGNITMDGAQESVVYNNYRLRRTTLPDTTVWGTKNWSIKYNGRALPYEIYFLSPSDSEYRSIYINYDAEGNRISSFQQHFISPQWDERGTLISGYPIIDHFLSNVDDRYEVWTQGSNITRYLYIGGSPETAHAVAEINGRNIKIYQIYRDELGSIIAMADSVNVNRYYYTPWGRYCDENGNVSSEEYYNGGNMGNPFYRGFLSQEYYAECGFVNLNARLYNPFIGRFLSSDPVFDPNASVIGFNPYIYGNNCPSMYADPDGEFPWLVFGLYLAFEGSINVAMNWDNFNGFWEGASFFGVGVLAGATTFFNPEFAPIIIGFEEGVNSILRQGYSNGWDNLQWDQVATDGISTALWSAVTMGTGKYLKGLGQKLASNITNSTLLQNLISNEISSCTFGTLVGTTQAIADRGNIAKSVTKTVGKSAVAGLKNTTYETVLDEAIRVSNKPLQKHHFATNKNRQFTNQMREIANSYGLQLEEEWNTAYMPHQGRHPNLYHTWVYNQMKEISNTPNMNREQFLIQFDLKVKQPVTNNPNMLTLNSAKPL